MSPLRYVHHAEPPVEDAVPPAGRRPAVRAGPDGLYADFQRHAGLRSADENRAAEGVPTVSLRVGPRKLLRPAVRVQLFHSPARVQRAEDDRVAGVDGKDRLQL